MERTRISHYELRRPLGRGGMGEVYEAFDLDAQRPVALKFIGADIASNPVRRFNSEATIVFSLNHAHIARFYEFGHSGDRSFIAMELLTGPTLRERIRNGPMPVVESLAVARDVAAALAYAHHRGIVHRSIAPENLMFDEDGRIKIIDFGLAQILDERVEQSDDVAGIPAYMSPESFQGKVGPPADVFALGAVLVEMITGRMAFQGESLQAVMFSIANLDPRPLRESRPDAPKAVERLVSRLLEKDPERRPDAASVARELAELAPRSDLLIAERRTPVGPPSSPGPDFRVRAHERREQTSPHTRLEWLQFSATFPASLAPGETHVLDVWVHLAKQRGEVLSRAREESNRPIAIKSQGPVGISRGTRLEVRVIVSKLVVERSRASLVWIGTPGNASFLIAVPADAEPGKYPGYAIVSLAGLRIARLSFVLNVEKVQTSSEVLSRAVHPHRTAFASYASRDRPAVMARVHGLRKAGVDVFMDVLSLRSGQSYERILGERIETSDVFYLFWSKAARESTWVDREWHLALARRGLDYIDPFPLVPPDRVPPPPELVSKHFNDWELAYLCGRSAARRWWQFWVR